MAPPLSDAEIEDRLKSAGEWRRAGTENGGQPAIVRDLKREDFAAAIALVNRVAELAEEANHHPDILVHGWNNVRLTLSTHSEGGLTDADFRLAAQIEDLL
jgi:4a-hydroxytetrahydrobiopterin dehydratase